MTGHSHLHVTDRWEAQAVYPSQRSRLTKAKEHTPIQKNDEYYLILIVLRNFNVVCNEE